MHEFDVLPNRLGLNSEKWNVLESELPMWVADMDFDNAPAIKKALLDRVNLGAYGYSYPSDEYFNSFIRFYHDRHHVDYIKDDLIFATGVVPAISSIVRKLTTIGEKVIVMSPVYNVFYNSIVNNGRFILECPLKYDKINNSYSIDFDNFEKLASDNQASMIIFCNPQNPTGNIWSKEELKKVLDIAKKNNLIFISDEVHCDLTSPNKEYNPIFSICSPSDNVIALSSASKSFNLAGMPACYVIVKNKNLHYKAWRGINTDEVGEGNAFFDCAYVAAFNDSRDWLDDAREYIYQNKLYVYDFLEKNSKARVVRSDATYLIWVDLASYDIDSSIFCPFLREKTGLFVNPGFVYGGNSKSFVRINLATSRSNVVDGMNRLIKGLKLWLDK